MTPPHVTVIRTNSGHWRANAFAWLGVAVVFLLGWVLWLVPVSWYGIREWLFPLAMIPLVTFALFVAWRRRNWLLGVAAAVSTVSPVIALTIGWIVVILQEQLG